MPTNWPECGRLGLGTVPTGTASWACLVFCVLGCVVPAKMDLMGMGVTRLCQPATGRPRSAPVPTPFGSLELSVLVGKALAESRWGFGARASLPHPQEEMSVRTRLRAVLGGVSPGQSRAAVNAPGHQGAEGVSQEGRWLSPRADRVPGPWSVIQPHGLLGAWGPCLQRAGYLPEAEPG